MSQPSLRVALGPMRLPFLILTPACVALGAATALWSGASLSPLSLVLVLVGAVAAHVSVNALNEYDDFKSGLDLRTEPTPFSGGSKTLPQHPQLARTALAIGLGSLVLCAGVGVYFIYLHGWRLLPLGACGLILVVVYTRWITRSPLLCLLAPGLGFGPLMVVGTHFALTGDYAWTPLVASLVPMFLVSDLLLLNQFPDVEADRSIGRRHLPISIGRSASAKVYTALLVGAYLAIVAGSLAGLLPLTGLLGLGTAVLAVPTVSAVLRHADDVPKLMPAMGRNVLINILTPLLLAVGVAIG